MTLPNSPSTGINNNSSEPQNHENNVINEEEEISVMRAKNIALAEDLLSVINKVKVKQDEWQAVLTNAMVQEKTEEAACNKMFKSVARNQALIAKSGAFEQWMNDKMTSTGGKDTVYSGLGMSKIIKWYHDDHLSQFTPYCAILPFPKDLSEEGRRALIMAVRDLNLSLPFSIESFPCIMSTSLTAAGLGIRSSGGLAPSEGDVGSRAVLPAPYDYLAKPMTSGEDVINAVGGSSVLQEAVGTTECLFLNDMDGPVNTSAYIRRNKGVSSPCALIQCIIIGGVFVAGEFVATDGNHQESAAFPCLSENDQRCFSELMDSDSQNFASYKPTSFRTALYAFVSRLISPTTSVLYRRSVKLVITAHITGNFPSVEPEYSFFLRDVFPFDGINYECFSLEEILIIAEFMERRKEKLLEDAEILENEEGGELPQYTKYTKSSNKFLVSVSLPVLRQVGCSHMSLGEGLQSSLNSLDRSGFKTKPSLPFANGESNHPSLSTVPSPKIENVRSDEFSSNYGIGTVVAAASASAIAAAVVVATVMQRK